MLPEHDTHGRERPFSFYKVPLPILFFWREAESHHVTSFDPSFCFLVSADYNPGLLCMMPPSVKTVVAVM